MRAAFLQVVTWASVWGLGFLAGVCAYRAALRETVASDRSRGDS